MTLAMQDNRETERREIQKKRETERKKDRKRECDLAGLGAEYLRNLHRSQETNEKQIQNERDIICPIKNNTWMLNEEAILMYFPSKCPIK